MFTPFPLGHISGRSSARCVELPALSQPNCNHIMPSSAVNLINIAKVISHLRFGIRISSLEDRTHDSERNTEIPWKRGKMEEHEDRVRIHVE